jgi:predicted transposase/invertase (TIGR01784 family)
MGNQRKGKTQSKMQGQAPDQVQGKTQGQAPEQVQGKAQGQAPDQVQGKTQGLKQGQPQGHARSIHQPADTAFKSLFQSKRAFVQLLRYFLKAPWVEFVDEQQLERIDKSYIKTDHARLESDVVYKCRMKDQEVIIYVLLELQSTVDYQMPWRLLQYMVELWRSMQKDVEASKRRSSHHRLPPIIPVVVYNGDGRWTASRSFKEYQYRNDLFGDAIVNFRYYLVDVRRWSPESKAELEAFLPLAFHFENAESILDLSERIDTCMQAVQKLDASESMVLADFLNQIALQRLSRESGDNNAQRVLPSIAVGASGGEMVSQLSRRLHKEYEEWKRKELQMLERGRQEGQRLLIVQMRHNGMTISQIAKLISMEEAEVEALLNE